MSFAPIPVAARAAELAFEITAEESRVVELENELAALRASIANKKFILAPIRRLPWEMLAAICAASIQHDPLFIVTLSHVCRSFRHAALVSPTLWATFSINTANCKVNDLVSTFLAHSGSVPLNITIPRTGALAAMCQKHTDEYTAKVESIMRLLHEHQHRLRSLDLNVPGLETAQAALAICSGPAPELQRLQITLDCDQQREREELIALKDAFQPCPNLRVLKLQHCELPVRLLSAEQGAFSSVLSLSLNHLSAPLSRLTRTLNLLPNLRTLSCVRWSVPPDDLDLPKIHLPALKKLVIVDETTGKSGLSILGSLTAPALQRLSLKYLFDADFSAEDGDDMDYHDSVAQVGETVRDFLQRSSNPRLVLLELLYCEMPADDLTYILRRADHVEELALAGRVPSGTLRSLAAIRSDRIKKRPCVPRMQTLSLADAVIKPKAITRLIEARNLTPEAPYRPLQRLKLANCAGVTETDRVQWAAMDAKRLAVERTVTDPPPPRALELVSDMLDAMVFGPYGPSFPLYF